jgi:hypothetical protein
MTDTTAATFILSYDALTSELDAVNQMISSMGEAPVTTLVPSPSIDVDNALAALNEADKQVQRKGWEWNREYAFPLQLAADGTCPLPANILRVVAAYESPPTDVDIPDSGVQLPGPLGPSLKVVARGLQLYDQINQTYVFQNGPIYVDTIVRLQWDLLPETARAAIALTALGKFQSRSQQSSIVLQFNPQDLKEAMADLQNQQDDESQQNSIDGNNNVVQALYGFRGLRRNRQGF